jgi:LmbE family N-acetylglucosaminyl deacetylase
MPVSRRSFTKNAASILATLSLNSLAHISLKDPGTKIKIVCVGGHPDDPESGCGGTLAKLASAGNDVSIIYLTRGEAGIDSVSHTDAAAIRTKEAEAACRILNATPVFAGQIDGDTIVNNEWVKKIHALIKAEKPAIVFTHWPVDSHKDHQAASLLTIQSWLHSGKSFDLYFFEVCTGSQTMGFRPDTYMDITSVLEQKHKAVYCHTSQHPESIYNSPDCNHAMMEQFRGKEINIKAAEAFVKMQGSGLSLLFDRQL